MATLMVVTGPSAGRSFALAYHTLVMVGRDEACTFQLADDYVSRHYLFVLSLFLDMNRSYQAIACDYRKVNEVGAPISTHSFRDDPIACGIMFTYESLSNLRFYSEQFRMREGHDLLARFTKQYELFHLPMPLYRYRMHENNRTLSAKEVEKYDAMLEEELDAQQAD